jgi:hypothetical protein
VLRFVGPFFEQPVMIIGRRDAVLLDLAQLTGRRLALPPTHFARVWLDARHPSIELVPCAQLAACVDATPDTVLREDTAPRVITAVNAASAAGAPMPALVVKSAALGDADMQALREAGADLVLAKASHATLFVRQMLKHPALRGAQKEALA